MIVPTTHAVRLTAVALVATSLLAGCSGGSDSSGQADPPVTTGTAATTGAATTAPASTTATPSGSTTYLSAPIGVSLTPEGTQLTLGTAADVAWQPRQGLVGVLHVKVIKLLKASYRRDFVGWDIKSGDRSSQPYFVKIAVKNVGDTELGDRDVPLYIVDGSNVLVQASSFASTFKPCPHGQFPHTFSPGDTANLCLVYLAPHAGRLTAVSFRPTEDFDPISWKGKLVATKDVKATPAKGGKGKGKGKGTVSKG